MLENRVKLLQAEEEVFKEAPCRTTVEFMMIDDKGELTDIHLNEVKTQAAATVAGQMHEANLSIKQLVYLDWMIIPR